MQDASLILRCWQRCILNYVTR